MFVADVCARRFPSSRARKQVSLPFEGRLAKEIDLDEQDPDRRQLSVDLDAGALSQAQDKVVEVARDIKNRRFHVGPQRKPRHDGNSVRCQKCDFDQFCGLRASSCRP